MNAIFSSRLQRILSLYHSSPFTFYKARNFANFVEQSGHVTSRSESFSKWYSDSILAADLIDPRSPVRGSLIMKPRGYAIWELLQKQLDEKKKKIERLKLLDHERRIKLQANLDASTVSSLKRLSESGRAGLCLQFLFSIHSHLIYHRNRICWILDSFTKINYK